MPDFPVQPHHQRTIDKIAAHFAADPTVLALLVGGSVAKGRARPDSDVDVAIIVTAAEYARRAAVPDALVWFNTTLHDAPSEYCEGKFIDLAFLNDVAERGSEPARAAFKHSFIVYSHLPDLPALLARVTAYPEADLPAKIRAFYSECVLSTWYMSEAQKRNNRYLLTHFAANLALFGGRLILAHNKILYPYHKWFMWEVEHAPAKPADFLDLMGQLLAEPSKENAAAFLKCVENFRDWGTTHAEANQIWVAQNEWAWRSGKNSIADW